MNQLGSSNKNLTNYYCLGSTLRDSITFAFVTTQHIFTLWKNSLRLSLSTHLTYFQAKNFMQ